MKRILPGTYTVRCRNAQCKAAYKANVRYGWNQQQVCGECGKSAYYKQIPVNGRLMLEA